MGAIGTAISAMRWTLIVCVAMALCSCIAQPQLMGVDSGPQPRQIELTGAGNEWVSFNARLAGRSSRNLKIRFASLEKLGCDVRAFRREKAGDDPSQFGEALVPIKSERGLIEVSGRGGAIWVDVHLPERLAGGEYQGACELLDGAWVVDRLPIDLKVRDFSLPARASLAIVGEMNSAALRKLYGGQLPDSLTALFESCRENRVELWFSDLPGSRPATEERSAATTGHPLDEEMVIGAAGLNANLLGIRTVHWRDPAGMSSQDPAWFYPGKMFGQAEPVQSVWLKLMRQSEQDAEYLKLAEERGQGDIARKVARLMVRQREGEFAEFETATDERTSRDRFKQGRRLLAELIEAYGPVHPISTEAKRQLSLDLAEWIAEHGRPMMLPRWSRWTWDSQTAGQLDLELGLDVFNPSDNQALRSSLRWSGTPVGWRNVDAPTVIPQMPAHRITPVALKNSFDATAFHITTSGAMQAMVISGFDGSSSTLDVQLPVASCDRRSGSPVIDGSLSDWSSDDAAFDGNLVYLSPVSDGAIHKAAATSGIYTNYSSDALFVAFRLDQEAAANEQCQIVIQPMYAGGSLGGMMRLNCMANGAYRGAEGIRYAATLVDGIWRGEVAIPWSVVGDKGIPTALRFNFLRQDAGGWTSWAGPIEKHNNDDLTGILVLRNGPGELVK